MARRMGTEAEERPGEYNGKGGERPDTRPVRYVWDVPEEDCHHCAGTHRTVPTRYVGPSGEIACPLGCELAFFCEVRMVVENLVRAVQQAVGG